MRYFGIFWPSHWEWNCCKERRSCFCCRRLRWRAAFCSKICSWSSRFWSESPFCRSKSHWRLPWFRRRAVSAPSWRPSSFFWRKKPRKGWLPEEGLLEWRPPKQWFPLKWIYHWIWVVKKSFHHRQLEAPEFFRWPSFSPRLSQPSILPLWRP